MPSPNGLPDDVSPGDVIDRTGELAASVGLPEATVRQLVEGLAGALTRLRSSMVVIAEQELVETWRATFGDLAGMLDEPDGYLRVALAMDACADLLGDAPLNSNAQMLVQEQVGAGHRDNGARAGDQLGTGRRLPNRLGPRVLAAGIGAHRTGQLSSDLLTNPDRLIAQITQRLGWPGAEQAQWAASVTAAVRAIQGSWQARLTDALTIEALGRLVVGTSGAHALAAPDEVRQLIEAALGPTAGGVVDPGPVTRSVVSAEITLQQSISVARERFAQMKKAEKDVYSALKSFEITANLHLNAAGIDTDHYVSLIQHQAKYNAGGFWKKLELGTKLAQINIEADRLRRIWREETDRAQHTVDEALEFRRRSLADVQPVAEHTRNAFPVDLLQRPVYVGAELMSRHPGSFVLPHTLWEWNPLHDHNWARLPELRTGAGHISFVPGEGLSYDDACQAVRSIVLDQMSRARPRQLQLTWLDPAGRGQSAGAFLELLEIEKSLIDDKVWSEQDEITAALRRVSDRMAYLEQRCLKDTYPSLVEYNQQAGSLAEPFHVVVATGFPAGFSEDSVTRLNQIAQAGERLGVSVLVVLNAESPRVYSGINKEHPYPTLHSHPGLTTGNVMCGYNGQPHATITVAEVPGSLLIPVVIPVRQSDAASAIVRGYGTAAVSAANVVIDNGSLISESDSPRTSERSLDVPLGVRGRGNAVVLGLGAGMSQNVLVGGLPGSGKSSLFHTLITNAIRAYSPDELELYLLDFKQGVEFQSYANGAVPHAVVVAVQSERDFGLSVLRDLREEITRRSALFRRVTADSLTEYRERSGETLPRVMVVVDEFQVMFADDDRVAHECAQLLDHLIRQGRAFGIHTVLGTQSLRGQGAMSLLRGTLDQVAVRIVLRTSEADSRLFLADDNPVGARLTRPGEAVFNPDGGQPEGNVEFQVALTSDEVRDTAVAKARARADEAGFVRRPLVFDGTRAITIEDDEVVRDLMSGRGVHDRKVTSLHLGLPVAIRGSGAVTFSRRAGRHLLVVLREPGYAIGAIVTGLVTAERSSAEPPLIDVIDCLGIDEDHSDDLVRHQLAALGYYGSATALA